jgi:predicted Co/Zn/Cd cation transporter (cation efflux family)
MAVIISKTSRRTSSSFPDGIYFIEPLYAILKSLLELSLLVFSAFATAIPAYEYFAHGAGSEMNIGPVLPYTIIMVALCFSLGFYNRHQNKKINNTSTILTAESKANFVDGLQSAGIGVGVILLYFISETGPLGFLHYTADFFITIILVIISLRMPIKVIISAFKELTGGTTDNETITQNINTIIDAHLKNIVTERRCDIFKVGMHIRIRIKIVNGIKPDLVEELRKIRERMINELKLNYDSIELSYAF